MLIARFRSALLLATCSALVMMNAATKAADPIVAEVVVNAPRSEVWQAWSTTEGVTAFFAPNAHIELRHRGPYEVYFLPDNEYGSRGAEGCEVLCFVPEEMISFTWSAPPTMPHVRRDRTFVVIQLSDAGEGKTRVRLTNDGYKSDDQRTEGQWAQAHDYFTKAWPRVLASLVKRFDDGPLWPEDARHDVAPPKRNWYCYFLNPADEAALNKPTPDQAKAFAGHVKHIQNLAAESRLALAGPCDKEVAYPSDNDACVKFELPNHPGLVVFAAADLDEAKEIMEADPAIQAGIFASCVKPFYMSFSKP